MSPPIMASGTYPCHGSSRSHFSHDFPLTLLAVTLYLYRKRKPVLYTMLPMLLVLGATISAMFMSIYKAISTDQWMVAIVGGVILFLSLWAVVEAILVVRRIRVS
ncbi:MAG: hypothetical protein ABFS56_29165 [Pseudomonadota bacterium]